MPDHISLLSDRVEGLIKKFQVSNREHLALQEKFKKMQQKTQEFQEQQQLLELENEELRAEGHKHVEKLAKAKANVSKLIDKIDTYINA